MPVNSTNDVQTLMGKYHADKPVQPTPITVPVGSVELEEPAELPPQSRRTITLIPATTVATEKLEWLIDSWIPRRSITLLAGREGLGKSTIACDIAARASRGEYSAGRPMNVAYLATEDSLSITVKPRLQAAGADLNRVMFLQVTTPTGGAGTLSLPGDTDQLAEVLHNHHVELVILDAAKSAMHSSLDGHRDDDVRQFLEPLASMCDRLDMALIGLTHFGKRESNDPGKLMLGSVAWSQIARSVLSVARDEDNSLIVTNTKGNLAPRTVSRRASMVSVDVPTDDGQVAQVGRVEWGDVTDISAADLLGRSDDDGTREERSETQQWLADFLEVQGPTPRQEVLRAAKAALGVSDRTMRRALTAIGGTSKFVGSPPIAVWSIPPQVGQDSQPPTPARVQAVQAVQPEADLQKHNVQPGGKNTARTGWTHSHALGTEYVHAVHTDAEAAIISALSVEHGQTTKALAKSVPAQYRDDVPDALERLVAEGQSRRDGRQRYFLVPSQS